MLTEDDKKKIRLEESYRFEVRKTLGDSRNQKRWYQILWSLLNSTFTIFILGSVVVVSITSYFEHKRQEDFTRDARVKRSLELAEEIKWRIDNIEVAIERSSDIYPNISNHALQEIQNQLDGSSSLQEKFKNRKLAMLLRDLKNIQLERDYVPWWNFVELEEDNADDEYVIEYLDEEFRGLISLLDEFDSIVYYELKSTDQDAETALQNRERLYNLLYYLKESDEFIQLFLTESPALN